MSFSDEATQVDDCQRTCQCSPPRRLGGVEAAGGDASLPITNGSGRRRRVAIHYHPKKTYGASLLQGLLEDIGWNEDDLQRLRLIKRERKKSSSAP